MTSPEVVWQGGDPGDMADGRRWRVLQLLQADGWWWVDCTEPGAVPTFEAERLIAFALIEVCEPDGSTWQTTTGLDRWRAPVELRGASVAAEYRHTDDLPEHVDRIDGGPDLRWRGGLRPATCGALWDRHRTGS